jgi:UDP-3-O-[3-hydroxymyristoyl] glucosamine N-acyltransferase
MPIVSEIIFKYRIREWMGSIDREVSRISVLSDSALDHDCLVWLSSSNLDKLLEIKNSVVLCPWFDGPYNQEVTYLFVDDPRKIFADVIEDFFYIPEPRKISNLASIDSGTVVGSSFSIGAYAIIESGCVIGNDVEIGSGTIIKRNTIIGNNVVIGSNCTIGGIGFGYVADESGLKKLMRHIGNVIIGDFVEIGNNSCIDRAVIGSTILEKNVKVDNLVHIAHGVKIGQNSLVIASAQIAGSVNIGRNCWIAPNSSIIQKVTLGNNVTVGIGAVVLKDVTDGGVVMGNPARNVRPN